MGTTRIESIAFPTAGFVVGKLSGLPCAQTAGMGFTLASSRFWLVPEG